jgi:hypothetical protein
VPVFSRSLPKVAIPRIDQIALGGQAGVTLLHHALAIADSDTANRRSVLTDLEGLLGELRLPDQMPTDGPPLSLYGLKELGLLLDTLGDARPLSDRARRIGGLINSVADRSEGLDREESDRRRYVAQRQEINRTLAELEELLEAEATSSSNAFS